jgi:hypothetical protein
MTVERLMLSQAEAAAAALRSAANLLEQMPGNGDLGDLEGDTPCVFSQGPDRGR